MQVGIQETVIRKTYPQDWKAYNAAQTSEKAQFLKLLHTLCANIEEPPQTRGRPRIPLKDAIFSVCYKIYSTVSARRFMSDLAEAQIKGYIEKTPHFNAIYKVLQTPEVHDVLQELIKQSSLPLTAVEQDFAADSSGFTASRFSRWYDHKYGQKQQHDWVKLHLMAGVKTHVVTAVEIRDKDASDTKLLPDLVKTTAENFTLSEVSADKGYASINNYAVIERHGATPYICFKENHTGSGLSAHRRDRPGTDLWKKMYHLFKFNEDEYRAHYHKRSNVETVFSMMKSKFGDSVRSKTDAAMVNEVLCKVVCHNICVLINAMHELDIEVDFSSGEIPSPRFCQ